MAIEKGVFINLSYTGSIEGIPFDTTSEEVAKEAGIFNESARYGPMLIKVGNNHVIPGLDEALEGADVGVEQEVTVPPEKGFGPHEKEKVQAYPLKAFEKKPAVGMRITVEKREGVVVDIIGQRAVVDFNHPIAGKTLDYTFTIEEVVEDDEEKMKGLIRLFSGRDMDLTLEDEKVTLHLPPGINYDQRWFLWRGTVVQELFGVRDSVSEIVFMETFKRPEEAAES
ncbi:MAG: peptidylprolyl isomerase [Methanocalculus sp. MSAO_Arc1]|uniref:FKBP-type peptidyl-prolyl cis-trans isomerase n=1 Tax=Methanocalculus TaxID=71151 RepID=UPI000FF42E79|nr:MULTISPECIES: peptidylprolyl isomerase [unclassified Methanocalculus]MCP1661943.1 FKBP-type peptidyl-prolyl cis-trans isomerase SlyD [Methanocalculus sp. AMF5]RQD80544.1 MAG: peptidylprolyl isomerase [Methanocalculus sp. MSAO_Arc1]